VVLGITEEAGAKRSIQALKKLKMILAAVWVERNSFRFSVLLQQEMRSAGEKRNEFRSTRGGWHEGETE